MRAAEVRACLAAAYAALAAVCGAAAVRDWKRARGVAPDAPHSASLQANARRGFDARVSFHRATLVAAATRAGALAAEALTADGSRGSERRWWEDLVWSLPAFLFLTALSLVVLLWARLVHAGGVAHYFVALNAAAYAVVAGAAGITLWMAEYGALAKLLLYARGCASAVVSLLFVWYGARVARSLAASLDSSAVYSSRRRVMRRVVAIAAACAAALAFGAAWSLLAASGAVRSFFGSAGIGRAAWEAAYLGATELFPSAVVLALTLRRSGRRRRMPGGGGYVDLTGGGAVDRQGRLIGDDEYPDAMLSVADAPDEAFDAAYAGALLPSDVSRGAASAASL